MQPILSFIHQHLRHAIQAGDTVVDGTAGNGHDTLLLAQCVGEHGRVYAFDIQAAALESSLKRLQQHGQQQQVRLIHDSHARLAAYVPPNIAAAVFNFGYLPHGDKNITTLADSSIAAVSAALDLLQPGGLLAAALYPGHEQGQTETAALLSFAAALPPHCFRVAKYEFINQNACPVALLIRKAAVRTSSLI